MWKKESYYCRKTKTVKIDDFDEDLDGKYYIKKTRLNYETLSGVFFLKYSILKLWFQ
jgi:hypothetical protein